MTKRFGIEQATWSEAKAEIVSILTTLARSENLITYADLASRVQTISFEPRSLQFNQMLCDISRDEEAQGRGMLSALVVLRSGGRPGQGFFELAKELERSTSNRELCWSAEVQRIYQVFREPIGRKIGGM